MLLGEWLEASQREVATRYPQFAVVQPRPGSGSIHAWEGIIQPFPDDRELGPVFQHLEAEADVIVRAGRLLHDPECSQLHNQPAYIDHLGRTDCSFRILILAFPPKRHPQAFAILPVISRRVFPRHPHLYGDALCPYIASDGVWVWGEHTVTDFLDYVSIWLAKHLVWEQTGACNGGIWIGPYAPHEPHELLGYVRRNDECPCNSGRKYKRCCRPAHVSLVRKRTRQ